MKRSKRFPIEQRLDHCLRVPRELFRRAANLASNEDLNKILTNTFIILGHMFFRMHTYHVSQGFIKSTAFLSKSFSGKC